MKTRDLMLIAVAAAALVATPALAAGGGGGGGGGAPSASGSRVDPAKRYAQGVELLKAGNFKQAEKAFDDVLDAAPKDPSSNFMMSLTQIGQQDFEQARKYLRITVKYDANHVQARAAGSARSRRSWATRARPPNRRPRWKPPRPSAPGHARKPRRSTPASRGSISIPRRLRHPMQLSGDLVHFASAKDGDAAYLQAFGLINEGRYEDALWSLKDAALALGPHPDVLTYQGFANRKLHNYDVAVSYYSAALELAPDHRGANEYLGEYYVETGQMAKAKQQLVKLDTICKFGCEEAEELRRWIAGGHS